MHQTEAMADVSITSWKRCSVPSDGARSVAEINPRRFWSHSAAKRIPRKHKFLSSLEKEVDGKREYLLACQRSMLTEPQWTAYQRVASWYRTVAPGTPEASEAKAYVSRTFPNDGCGTALFSFTIAPFKRPFPGHDLSDSAQIEL